MSDSIQKGLQKAGVSAARRHLLICIGPDCCNSRQGELIWDFVKKRVKETGIPVMRSKAACFRICSGGPWLAVYPDGIWYGAINSARFERILQEHLLGGKPVREWVAARCGWAAECSERMP